MGLLRRIKDLLILAGWKPRGMEMLSTGEKAPEFTAHTHEGREVSLSDYAGRHVVLWFYPEADTPGWVAEGRGFRELERDFDKLGTQILGASFDGQAANSAFARDLGIGFPLLCDTDRKIGMAYHACDAPDAGFARRITYLIGPDGRIARAYETVSAARHAAQVLEDLVRKQGDTAG